MVCFPLEARFFCGFPDHDVLLVRENKEHYGLFSTMTPTKHAIASPTKYETIRKITIFRLNLPIRHSRVVGNDRGWLYDLSAESTHNRAERSLRPAVIARKISCGNDFVDYLAAHIPLQAANTG